MTTKLAASQSEYTLALVEINRHLSTLACWKRAVARPFVEWVRGSQMSEEATAIDKDRFHGSSWVSL
jgi:hypothetical protein